MSDYNIEDLCDELNVYLMNRFDYKSCPASNNKKSITARRKWFQLYFRFRRESDFWEADTFVIAVIEFFHTRSGHGTDLLRFLVKIADKYEISRIGIEQTNEESSAFAERFGFINFQSDSWIVDVAELKIQFKL